MPESRRAGSLLVIFLTIFIDLLGFGIVLPLLPVYGKYLATHGAETGTALTDSQIGITIGLLMASFSAMQFLFAPVWGRISDRIGRRPVLMVGLAASVVAYALFGVATKMQSMALLFASRIGAGIAGATISTAHAYIADVTTPEKRTKGMALIGMAFGLGFTLGPLFGLLAVPEGDAPPGPWPGYAAAILSFGALMLAWAWLPESLDPSRAHTARQLIHWNALKRALEVPSIGLLLGVVFLSVLSFANFESTLSVFIKDEAGAFRFSFRQLCWTFAFIGIVLSLVQGGLVRRLAGRVSEGRLASAGAAVEIVGLLIMAAAAQRQSVGLLYTALAVVVSGFAFVTPSLNSLLSRRSDPAQQGEILGLAQSASALGRIFGPLAGLGLYHLQLPASAIWPLYLGMALMVVSLGLVIAAAQGGKDFAAAKE